MKPSTSTPHRQPHEQPRKQAYLKPWIFGIIAGSVFVFVEVVFSFYPPGAYVFCLSCHTRDLVNTLSNWFFQAGYQVAAVGKQALMLTSPAVVLGAFFAASLFRERRPVKAEKPVMFFIIGFSIMVIGILIFGCPTRLLLRSGYGDLYGIGAVLAMLGGIAAGTALLRWRNR